MLSETQKSLRTGNVLIGDRAFYSQVVAIVLPIIIQNTVSNVVSLLDNVMVGAVGTLEMSSVAIVNQLLFVFYLCIFGGLAGAGIGLAFSMGGNSGGTDIIALILNKYYNISPGKVILYLDIIIIGCSFFVSGIIENVVYGYVQMGVMTYALDMVIDGFKQSYQIMVFSQHTKEIADRIGNEVGRGVTLLDGWGWYSKSDQKVLLVIARKVDKQSIMEIIQSSDPKAFISVAKVQGVYGKNFEKLKL